MKDKQLRTVRLENVLTKRRLEQVLNAKEFAVVAGISYSTARAWFRLPGFPLFRGVIFWQDFTAWRAQQNGSLKEKTQQTEITQSVRALQLPARAQKILHS